jgi:hypothetical protein
MALKPITTTAALTLSRNLHAGTVVVLDSTTGRIITLPASTGKGDVYSVYIKTTVSSGNHVIQVANSTDVMNGAIGLTTDIAGSVMPASATSDTITMNGSTTGGVAGSNVTFTDVAAGFWKINGDLICTGTEATPFSAAV